MNLASILVICVVAGLLLLAIAGWRKGKAEGCGGSCGECAFPCDRRR